MLIGMAANRFGGSELHLPGIGEQDGQPAILLEEEAVSFKDKLLSGLKWSFTELSVTVCKYAVSGMLIAGLIFNIFPPVSYTHLDVYKRQFYMFFCHISTVSCYLRHRTAKRPPKQLP